MRKHEVARSVAVIAVFALVFTLLPRCAFAEGGNAHAPTGDPAKPEKEKKPKNIQEKIDAVRSRLETAEQAILNSNKKKDCDGDGHCDVLEVGARACGGPTSYIVISELNPKVALVKSKVTEYTAVEKELNLLDTPECGPVPKALTARCEKNQCVGVPAK